MLQLVPTPRTQVPAIVAALGDASSGDPLLRFAGSIAGSHALVIAPNGLDLLCNLLRHGCAAAMALRLAERPDHEAYDLVLAPCVTSALQLGRLIYQAKRALVPTGRFIAFVPADSSDPDLAGLLLRSVRLGGFVRVRTQTLPNGLLVRADRPMHGLSASIPQLVRRHA